MASVSSLKFLLLQCSNIRSTPLFSFSCCSNSKYSSSTVLLTSSSRLVINKRGTSGCIKRQSLSSVMCFQKNQSQLMNYTTTSTRRFINDEDDDDDDDDNTQQLATPKKRRREALFQLAAFATAISYPSLQLIVSSSSSVALAETTSTDAKDQDFRIYSDETNKYTIMIPQDWQVGIGPGNGVKSVTAFYPPVASESNVSVLITGLGADFTRLESFGKVDEFAETLVSGLDRSWQRPPGVKAKLINSKASKGFYYIEYSLQNPGESCRHIFTSIGIASNTWYNRLYTVTGQFLEEDTDKYGSKIQKSVSSFKFT